MNHKKQCIVIGLGRFGTSLAESLSALEHDVLAIDINEDNVRHVHSKVSHAVQADVRDEEAMSSLGLSDFDVAIVAIGEDVESSCLAIIALQKQGVKKIMVKAKDVNSGKILKAVGADQVIYPEKDMGLRVAHNISSDSILDFFEFSKDYSIVEISAPSWCHNKNIKELNVRGKHHINIIAIKNRHLLNADVQADTLILPGDSLIVLGTNKNIVKFKD